MDYIQTSAVDKMVKFIDKGLDPNYQDSDTGGKECHTSPRTSPPVCHLAFSSAPFTSSTENNNGALNTQNTDYWF